jgi:hypothetical protein
VDRLAYRLPLTAYPSPYLIDFELLIGAQQQHLRPPHRKTVVRLQALAQHSSFFVCEWSCIQWFHPSIQHDHRSLFNPFTLIVH